MEFQNRLCEKIFICTTPTLWGMGLGPQGIAEIEYTYRPTGGFVITLKATVTLDPGGTAS